MRTGSSYLVFFLSLLVAMNVSAQPRAELPPAPVYISIIIDDLGNRLDNGLRTVELPGRVTCSFLPHTPFARGLAEMAHQHDKEVMLHQPMQAVRDLRMGPGGINLDMSEAQLTTTLLNNLMAIPHVRGVNNHMGSLLTRHPGHMQWLMHVLKTQGGLFFVDSVTTARSVAVQMATEGTIPHLRRDVFLDHEETPELVEEQFARLIRVAKRRGYAVGIGHPKAVTLKVLEQQLPLLEQQGVRLVPASELIDHIQPGSITTWQASLSR